MRTKRKLRRFLEIAGAAWRAYRYRSHIGAPVFHEALSLVGKLTGNQRGRTKLATWKYRLRACRGCDIYDPKHRTCGDNTGIIEVGGRLFPNGCSCKVGVKASDPDSDCVLADWGLASKWASLGITLDGTTASGDISIDVKKDSK